MTIRYMRLPYAANFCEWKAVDPVCYDWVAMPPSDKQRRPGERDWLPEPLHAPSPVDDRPRPSQSDRTGRPEPKPGSRVVVIDLA
jgi:hypothetical protein